MSLKSKLGFDNTGMFATFLFYLIAGIIFLVLLPITDFPPHIAIIGMTSLITAYGVNRKRGWTIWLAIILFFTATTFTAYELYYAIWKDLILGLGSVAYMVLIWIFTIYAAARRKSITQ